MKKFKIVSLIIAMALIIVAIPLNAEAKTKQKIHVKKTNDEDKYYIKKTFKRSFSSDKKINKFVVKKTISNIKSILDKKKILNKAGKDYAIKELKFHMSRANPLSGYQKMGLKPNDIKKLILTYTVTYDKESDLDEDDEIDDTDVDDEANDIDDVDEPDSDDAYEDNDDIDDADDDKNNPAKKIKFEHSGKGNTDVNGKTVATDKYELIEHYSVFPKKSKLNKGEFKFEVFVQYRG